MRSSRPLVLLAPTGMAFAAPVPKELRGPPPGVVGEWRWCGGSRIPSCCEGTIVFADNKLGRMATGTRPDGTPLGGFAWGYGKEPGTITFGASEVWTYKRGKGTLSITRNNLTADFEEVR